VVLLLLLDAYGVYTSCINVRFELYNSFYLLGNLVTVVCGLLMVKAAYSTRNGMCVTLGISVLHMLIVGIVSALVSEQRASEAWLGLLCPWIANLLLLGGTGLAGEAARKRRAHDHFAIHCRSCDYDLTGNVTGVCPECGTPVYGIKPGSCDN
jgi:hypothetical protein